MHAGLFVTLETESRFDITAHLAELTAQAEIFAKNRLPILRAVGIV